MVFVVLPGAQGTPSVADLEAAAKRLRHEVLEPQTKPPEQQVHIPRTLKYFPIDTAVRFSNSDNTDATIMEVIAPGPTWAFAPGSNRPACLQNTPGHCQSQHIWRTRRRCFLYY